MAEEVKYKDCKIISKPLPMNPKGYSPNGIIQIHKGDRVTEKPIYELQGMNFDTEEKADEYFINESKRLIDNW